MEWFKNTENVANLSQFTTVAKLGGLGVTLFFVLSGFLITYLLLTEKKIAGDINIKNFYVRRILRIWPLYFIIIGLSFFILPHFISIKGIELNLYDKSFFIRLVLFIVMLPNLNYAAFKLVPFASQLWSVGVEEQFYLAWPYLNKYKSKNIADFLLVIIFGMCLLKFFLRYYILNYNAGTFATVSNNLLVHFRIQCMAIGAIGAYILVTNKAETLRFIYSKKGQVLALILLAISVLTPFDAGLYNDEIISIVFVVLIVNAATNPLCLFSLENKLFLFLGRISYGIYMY